MPTPGQVLSPNMSLTVPVPGQENGPQWATDLYNCLFQIDAHNHTTGQGSPIPVSGLNINADIPMASQFNLVDARSVRLATQIAVLALGSDVGCVFNLNGDLYWNSGAGAHVQITNGGSIVGSGGTISGMVGTTAAATYVDAAKTFVWQSDSNVAANLDARNLILRNSSIGSYGLTLLPPSAMGADYNITLPPLPTSTTKILQMDTSGAMSAVLSVDGTTLKITSNILGVDFATASGLTGSQLANGTITGTQLASVLTIGTSIQVGSSGPTLSAGSATELMVGTHYAVITHSNSGDDPIRIAKINVPAASGASAPGISVSHPGTGDYIFTWFPVGTGITPTLLVTPQPGAYSPRIAVIYSNNATGAEVVVYDLAGNLVNCALNVLVAWNG
jgi:hypothetical protein